MAPLCLQLLLLLSCDKGQGQQPPRNQPSFANAFHTPLHTRGHKFSKSRAEGASRFQCSKTGKHGLGKENAHACSLEHTRSLHLGFYFWQNFSNSTPVDIVAHVLARLKCRKTWRGQRPPCVVRTLPDVSQGARKSWDSCPSLKMGANFTQ